VRRKKIIIPLALLALFSWGGLGTLFYTVSPATALPFPKPLTISPLPVFFLLFFLALFSSSTLLINSIRRGLLIAFGITILLLLRFFKLFHPLYIVLIVGLLITTEIYFRKK